MDKGKLQLDKQVIQRLQENQLAQLAGGATESNPSQCGPPIEPIVIEAEAGETNHTEEPQTCCRKSCR